MPTTQPSWGTLDLSIIGLYFAAMMAIGLLVRRRATRKLDSYFLADRAVPWWMLGLSGCSSYIDVGGTMAHGGRAVLPGPEVHLDHARLLGLVDDLPLHGVSGEIHPALGRDDLCRMERDAVWRDARRRVRPARRGGLPAGADGLQPDVHGGGHGQVRRGVPAVAALAIDPDRVRRGGHLRHAGRVLRRDPHRFLPDACSSPSARSF